MKTYVQNLVKGRCLNYAILVIYLLLGGILFYVPFTLPGGEIETFLVKAVPRVLWINFLLILCAIYLCRRDIAAAFTELWSLGSNTGHDPAKTTGCRSWRLCFKRPGFSLLLIVVAGLFLVLYVAPQTHRIFYDEDIYANMAQNIALTGQTGMANYGTFEYGEYFVNWIQYNKDPSGWPFLLSLVFQLFGVDEIYLFYLNNFLFAGGILVIFFITRLIAGAIFPGLLAALIYALIPHGLIWSNTGSAENPAAFFGALTVLCTFIYLRSHEWRHLFLLAAVLPFACYMRPESALIGIWTLVALAAETWSSNPLIKKSASDRQEEIGLPAHRPLATRDFWAMGLIVFALLIPHCWHFYIMSGQSWGAPGAKFSAFFFLKNLSTNGIYYLDNRSFPVLFTFLALIGILARRGRAILLLLWFLLFWGIFLFFYAGGYKYGADVRFALLSFMPLAVLAGLGGEVLREALGRSFFSRQATVTTALLVLFLIFSWIKFLPQIRLLGQEAWGARYDHYFAHEFIKRIPNRSVILSHTPTMFLLWGQNAAQGYAGINNPDLVSDLMKRYDGHVYFHYNYWCNAANDPNQSICTAIGQKYNLTPVASAREQKYEFGLYKMTNK